jgi:hypothetical protein
MPANEAVIEVRVDEASQLFNTLDPFPFRERDLDKDAEEYLVSWARELPATAAIKIVVHLPAAEIQTEKTKELEVALTRYFGYRADTVSRELRELFRIGQRALAIGLTVLAVCIIASRLVVRQFGSGDFVRFLQESLIILGWVANWRPIEIFLYDWWPIVRRRNLYRRLSAAAVELRPHSSNA